MGLDHANRAKKRWMNQARLAHQEPVPEKYKQNVAILGTATPQCKAFILPLTFTSKFPIIMNALLKETLTFETMAKDY